MMFLTLRDGTGFLQCVLSGNMCQTYDAVLLTTEASICIFGSLEIVPDGKTAPGGETKILLLKAILKFVFLKYIHIGDLNTEQFSI